MSLPSFSSCPHLYLVVHHSGSILFLYHYTHPSHFLPLSPPVSIRVLLENQNYQEMCRIKKLLQEVDLTLFPYLGPGALQSTGQVVGKGRWIWSKEEQRQLATCEFGLELTLVSRCRWVSTFDDGADLPEKLVPFLPAPNKHGAQESEEPKPISKASGQHTWAVNGPRACSIPPAK